MSTGHFIASGTSLAPLFWRLQQIDNFKAMVRERLVFSALHVHRVQGDQILCYSDPLGLQLGNPIARAARIYTYIPHVCLADSPFWLQILFGILDTA